MIPSDVRPDQPAGSASEIARALIAVAFAVALTLPVPRLFAQATSPFLEQLRPPVRHSAIRADAKLRGGTKATERIQNDRGTAEQESDFLRVFRAGRAHRHQRSQWETALGKQRGWLVRPKSTERLPALLLLAAGDARDFALQSAREIAGVGYVVLVVPLERDKSPGSPSPDAATASDSSPASRRPRWLRSRDDVFAYKLGVLGWGGEARWALELAAACELQAAVLADGDRPASSTRSLPSA